MNDVMAAALVGAIGELKNLPKTATAKIETKSGKDFSYSYAPLPDVLDAVKPVLRKYGLVLVQHVLGTEGEVGVKTYLVHESGDMWNAGSVGLPATEAKEAGAVVTYLRRYAICALLGLAAEDDLDAAPAPRRRKSGAGKGDAGTSTEAAPDSEPGEEPPRRETSASPGSPKKVYPADPAQCSHRYPSGNPLKADELGNCPKCGMNWVAAIEGTTEDLGPA